MIDHRRYWDGRLQRHFDLAGVGYLELGKQYNHWLYLAKTRAVEKAIRKFGIRVAGSRVLDVGCGTGYWVHQFECLGARDIVGLDSSPTSIANLRKLYPDHMFQLASIAARDPALSGKFDIISAFEVLWYLSEEEFTSTFANLAKLAAPGAHLLITDFLSAHHRMDGSSLSGDWYPRDLDLYSAECARNGFRILETLPLYYLMNAPTDSESIESRRYRAVLTGAWSGISRLLRRFPRLGHPLGAVLYQLDGLVLRYSACGPSTKLLVCQFYGGHE